MADHFIKYSFDYTVDDVERFTNDFESLVADLADTLALYHHLTINLEEPHTVSDQLVVLLFKKVDHLGQLFLYLDSKELYDKCNKKIPTWQVHFVSELLGAMGLYKSKLAGAGSAMYRAYSLMDSNIKSREDLAWKS